MQHTTSKEVHRHSLHTSHNPFHPHRITCMEPMAKARKSANSRQWSNNSLPNWLTKRPRKGAEDAVAAPNTIPTSSVPNDYTTTRTTVGRMDGTATRITLAPRAKTKLQDIKSPLP